MTNRPNGTPYIGVTNDIGRRAWEHRRGEGARFTSRHGLTRLVFMERHEDIETAIRPEKSLKRWPRAWKLDLVEGADKVSTVSFLGRLDPHTESWEVR